MDQSLEVFWHNFHSFCIFGVKNVKKSTLLVKMFLSDFFYKIEAHVKRMCLQTGPGDFKITNRLKFDIQ